MDTEIATDNTFILMLNLTACYIQSSCPRVYIFIDNRTYFFLDAVCNNRHFNKPTRAEFQAYTREALRSAKQRHRISCRVQRDKEQHVRRAREFWNDGCNEGEEETQSNIDSHDEDN